MIIKKNKKNIDNTSDLDKKTEEILPKVNIDFSQVLKDDIELEFENLNFNQRNERRRGNRRRGYRRIDDRKLISRAQEEADAIREKAAKEGFEKGIEMAHEELNKVKASICEVANIRDVVYNDIAKDILDIALAIAKKIINKEISLDKSVVLSMVTDALNECAKNENKITIKVSNENYDYLKNSIPKIKSETSIEAKMNVIAVSELSGNNIIIETGNGLMDISCDTQLKVLEEMFKTI